MGRAWKRTWIILRLKSSGASEADLLSVLRYQVLSVLQLAVPAGTTMLTKAEARSIEAVQKTGLIISHLWCQVQVVQLGVTGS